MPLSAQILNWLTEHALSLPFGGIGFGPERSMAGMIFGVFALTSAGD
jgi:hypothetical protein